MEDVSWSALSKGSPELAPQDKEGRGADLKECPPGFQEIAECLTAGGTPGEDPVSMDVPEVSVATIPLTEPAIAIVISTSMGRDQRMGAVCVNCDCLDGDNEFGGPPMAVGCQEATVEELVEEDLAEGHPDCVNWHFPFFGRTVYITSVN